MQIALGERPTVLMLLLFVLLVAMSWGYHQIFSGRAALLHLGAFTATIMTANVFLIIMPNQRIVVADLKAGRKPDPKYGKIAKLRSTHNNYLTLPVVFLMLSNHYPLAFATDYSWIIAALVFLMGVTIRHYFNTMHATGKGPHWTWGVTVILFLILAWLSTAPMWGSYEEAEARPMTAYEQRFAEAEGFHEAEQIVVGRCSMCHAREPVWDGIRWAPKGWCWRRRRTSRRTPAQSTCRRGQPRHAARQRHRDLGGRPRQAGALVPGGAGGLIATSGRPI